MDDPTKISFEKLIHFCFQHLKKQLLIPTVGTSKNVRGEAVTFADQGLSNNVEFGIQELPFLNTKKRLGTTFWQPFWSEEFQENRLKGTNARSRRRRSTRGKHMLMGQTTKRREFAQ